jgi:hypothetical protein
MKRRRTTEIDQAYWVAHCEGFQVRDGRKRIGFVEEVLDGGRSLSIRGGILGRRVVQVRAVDVLTVVPREMRIWLRTATPAFVARPEALVRNELPTAERRRAAHIAA